MSEQTALIDRVKAIYPIARQSRRYPSHDRLLKEVMAEIGKDSSLDITKLPTIRTSHAANEILAAYLALQEAENA